MKNNMRIREEAKRKGVFLWQIAAALGVNDGNFSRKLRHELPEKETEKILGIIAQLTEEAKSNET